MTALFVAGCIAWAVVERYTTSPGPLHGLPPVMLWAWERPEDIRFLDTERAGVAVLAGTLILRGEEVDVRLRMQPLFVPADAVAFPVVRIETDPISRPSLDARQGKHAVQALLKLLRADEQRVIQIDFDALVSERKFYADLIGDLRGALRSETRISITALASWCLGDPWIAGLPIDEAVPMLFQMGPDSADVHRVLRAGRDFALEVCRGSVGLSTDEPLAAMPAGRRVYVFHPRAWTPDAVNDALKEAEIWR